jgi:hypothetical protein
MNPSTRSYLRDQASRIDELRLETGGNPGRPAQSRSLSLLKLYDVVKKNGTPQAGKYLGVQVQDEFVTKFDGAVSLPGTMTLQSTDLPILAIDMEAGSTATVRLTPTAGRPLWVLGLYIGYTRDNAPLGADSIDAFGFWGGLPSGDVWVRITGDGGYGGGKYAGKIIKPPTADVVTAGTLADTDFGTDDADAIILNAQEINSATHWLTAAGNANQKTFVGRVLRYQTDGKAVVGINGLWAKTCE